MHQATNEQVAVGTGEEGYGMDKVERVKECVEEGQERLELHDFGATPEETYEQIKTEPIDNWVIHQTPQPRTPLPQCDNDDAIPVKTYRL